MSNCKLNICQERESSKDKLLNGEIIKLLSNSTCFNLDHFKFKIIRKNKYFKIDNYIEDYMKLYDDYYYGLDLNYNNLLIEMKEKLLSIINGGGVYYMLYNNSNELITGVYAIEDDISVFTGGLYINKKYKGKLAFLHFYKIILESYGLKLKKAEITYKVNGINDPTFDSLYRLYRRIGAILGEHVKSKNSDYFTLYFL